MPEIKVKKFSRSNIEKHLEVVEQPVQQPVQEAIIEPNNLNDKFEQMPDMPEMEDLFEDLNNENFVFENDAKKTKSEKEQIKLEREKLKLDVARKKEEERSLKELQKINSKKPTKATAKKSSDDDELFSSTPTELLGLDKRQLLAKLNQYKALFPKQLKTFKIKKNGPRKLIPGSFLINDGRTVMIRVGKARLPIKALQTIDVPSMFNTKRINAKVLRFIEDKFPELFKNEARFFTERFKAGK